MEHEPDEDHDGQIGERFWQPFVVAGQATAVLCPGEGAFDDPAPGQHELPTLKRTRTRATGRGCTMRCSTTTCSSVGRAA